MYIYECDVCWALVSDTRLHTEYHVNKGEETPSWSRSPDVVLDDNDCRCC